VQLDVETQISRVQQFSELAHVSLSNGSHKAGGVGLAQYDRTAR